MEILINKLTSTILINAKKKNIMDVETIFCRKSKTHKDVNRYTNNNIQVSTQY